MKRKIIRKFLKMFFIVLGGLFAALIITLLLFLNLSPEYGGKASKEKKASYALQSNYNNGIFINQMPTSLSMKFADYFTAGYDFLKGNKNRTPEKPIEVLTIDSTNIAQNRNGSPRVTWFGHTTILIEIEGKNILLDPVWEMLAHRFRLPLQKDIIKISLSKLKSSHI